jgi:ribose/xylose/arabinose/galactoside ABC-type transport system permease subunit
MSALSPSQASSQVQLNASGQRARLKQLAGDYGLIVVFIACLVLLSIGTNSFLTVSNLINVVRQSSIIGFIALGMTFVMITAGIDLSVGSVAGLAGVVAASLAPANSSAFALPVAAGLGTGLIVGLINAGLIIRGGVLPFLATLAVMAATRGITLIYTDGHPVSDLSTPFQWLGAGTFGIVPVPVVLFLLAAFFADHVLARTRFGRHVYAVGGNPEAARTVGIPVRRVILIVYLISATLAAFSGIVLTARVNGADPLAGTGYELMAIAAVVIGGTSLFGGVGTIRGTVLGVLLLAVVRNGLDLLNVSSYYQETVQGLILIVAVLLNRWKSD